MSKKHVLNADEPQVGNMMFPIRCGANSVILKRGNGGVVTWVLEDKENMHISYRYQPINMTTKDQFKQLWDLIDSWSRKVGD